jgi:hypothetical protein
MDAISILQGITWMTTAETNTARLIIDRGTDKYVDRPLAELEWNTKLNYPEYKDTGIILYNGSVGVTDVEENLVADFERVAADATVKDIITAIRKMTARNESNLYIRHKYFEGLIKPGSKRYYPNFNNNVFEVLTGS